MREKPKKAKNINKDRAPIVFLLLSILMIGILLAGVKYLPLQTGTEKTMNLPELKIMVATDLHYISPELTDRGYYFQAIVQDADGKTMMYSEEVIDAFVLTVLREKPDVNGVEKDNHVSEETLLWLEQELKRAKEDGIPVLAFSHQNLIRHSPLFSNGYVINNAEAVVRLYKEYDVIANFTGHLHIQHIEQEEDFYEIATAALAISPTQYARITLGGNTMEYQTEPVNVSEWAKQQGITTGTLTYFEEYAKRFFMNTAEWQAYSELFFWPEYEAMMEDMINYYVEQNYAYFTGRLDLVEQDEEMLNAWSELGAFISVYLESIAAEDRINQNYLLIEVE